MRRYNLLLLATCYLLLTLLACGRRGDPVAIIPTKGTITTEGQGREVIPSPDIGGEKVPEPLHTPHQDVKIIIPPPPTGLKAVYTGEAVILTWDEIVDKDIEGYNIYRSSDNDFILIGKAITPAFTDRDVMPGKRYIYRVTAIYVDEGPPSQEITLVTEPR
ncbi:MAG: fibronectin type III domain-containing protein [Thermodesulfovibrionia bacterium]